MSRRKREPSDEEIALFHETFRDVRPARNEKQARTQKGEAPSEAKRAAPQLALTKTRADQSGLDGRTAERLRRGQLEPEARLDLHGMTEDVAHRSLAQFLAGARARGLRLVLVVTGKGAPPDDDAPFDLELSARTRGVLKTMTPRWLKEPELAALVAATRTAHRRHGGQGALYIYLRKRSR